MTTAYAPARGMSVAESVALLSPDEQIVVLGAVKDDRQALLALMYDWRFWARPAQLPPPGSWHIWLIMAGRGFGKNRSGSEWVRHEVEEGRAGHIALISRTAADARDVMVEGESGVLAVSPPWSRPSWEPSKRRLTWPNGAMGTTYSAEEPEAFRGPQHDLVFADEIATWKYPKEAWENIAFGRRLGDHPRTLAATTPRPTVLVRSLVDQATTHPQDVVLTRGTTYDNRANITEDYYRQVAARYEGTRLARQELYGELLEDVPGALWTHGMLDRGRVREVPRDATGAPALRRVVVAVDPGKNAENETGIVAAGKGIDGHYYVLEDGTVAARAALWAAQVVNMWARLKADRVVAEQNFGGEMVESVLRNVRADLPYKSVEASRGKRVRAEPIAALYERNLVHHVGTFPALEDQLCSWTGEANQESPDRLDALVWALTELSAGVVMRFT